MSQGPRVRIGRYRPVLVLLAGLLAGPGLADPPQRPATTQPAGARPVKLLPDYPDAASEAERKTLDALALRVEGAVVYCTRGRAWLVSIGHWKPQDLGPADFARISGDASHVALVHRDKLFVVDTVKKTRKQLDARVGRKDGCPIDFHPNGRSIVYWRNDKGFCVRSVDDQEGKNLELPGKYSGAPSVSADGMRMACRWGNSLYAIDLAKGTHRKYARGCSPGVSPDGQWLMNNNGGHRTVTIQSWDGKQRRKIDTRTARPDRRWDNHHWSNHGDYIAAQGEGQRGEAYVVQISENLCTRVSWQGHVSYPDVAITRDKTRPTSQPTTQQATGKDRKKPGGQPVQ